MGHVRRKDIEKFTNLMFQKVISHPGGSALCPECREAVSKEANICPHCRTDLKNHEAWQKARAQDQASPGCALGMLLIACSFTGLAVCSYWLS